MGAGEGIRAGLTVMPRNILVDLVRFELTTSSMPGNTNESLARASH